MNLRPLQDFILSEPLADRMPGGLVAPASYQPDEVVFRALAIGPRVKDIAVGQRFICRADRVEARAVEVDGKKYRLINERDVLLRIGQNES
jgi:co-chaperonin GroES (HSP10)